MLPQNDQGYTGTFLHKPVTHLNILPVVVLSVPLFSVNVWTTVKSSMIFPNLSRVAQENNDCQLTFSGTPFLSHCSARKVIGFYTALSPHHALPETLKGLDYGHIYTINLITPTPHALKHWKDRTIVLESIKPTPHTPLLWWKALDWWKQCGSIDLRTLFPSLAKCKHTVAFLRLLVHKICTHLKCIPVPTSTVNLLWLIQTVWTLRRRRKEEVEDLMQNITTMVYLYLGLW